MNTKERFDKCKNASSQWEWVAKNKNFDFTIVMDNDCTWINFGDDEEGDSITSDFNEYLGQSDGAILLLKALGINAEYC